MTREDAIEHLKEWKEVISSGYRKAVIDMAIEALKENNQSDSLVRDEVDACKESESKLDLISRQDAIEAVVCHIWHMPNEAYRQFNCENIVREVVEDAIKRLPSAEAVQGEWIDVDNYYRMATCSHCHKVTMFEKWGEYTKPYNFCPNCGARMRGGDSE